MEILVLLPDRITGVDFGDIAVSCRDGLLQLCLLCRFVLAGFGGLSVELLGCELGMLSERKWRVCMQDAHFEVKQSFLEARHGEVVDVLFLGRRRCPNVDADRRIDCLLRDCGDAGGL